MKEREKEREKSRGAKNFGGKSLHYYDAINVTSISKPTIAFSLNHSLSF